MCWGLAGGYYVTTQQAQFTEDELDVIKSVERTKGRALTEQEINLALAQARAIGDL